MRAKRNTFVIDNRCTEVELRRVANPRIRDGDRTRILLAENQVRRQLRHSDVCRGLCAALILCCCDS